MSWSPLFDIRMSGPRRPLLFHVTGPLQRSGLSRRGIVALGFVPSYVYVIFSSGTFQWPTVLAAWADAWKQDVLAPKATCLVLCLLFLAARAVVLWLDAQLRLTRYDEGSQNPGSQKKLWSGHKSRTLAAKRLSGAVSGTVKSCTLRQVSILPGHIAKDAGEAGCHQVLDKADTIQLRLHEFTARV